MLYIGIKDGKIYDIRSNLLVRRNDMIAEQDYIQRDGRAGKEFQIEDTWDFDNDKSLEDSPLRISTILTNIELEDRLKLLESRTQLLEEKEIKYE